MTPAPVFIVGAKRTPIGSYQGALSKLRATELGSVSIRAALEAAKVDAARVDEVFFGNVLSAGIGQAPARQAALAAGLPNGVPCTTVNKVCGSGLQAVILGARAIALGDAEIVVTGGMESMSNVPYYLDRARTGYRMGHGKLIDGMIHDGLWDPYNDFHMGEAGEMCAAEYGISRGAQDDFATESYGRALAAQRRGAFDAELAAVSVTERKGVTVVVKEDEEPGRGKLDEFPKLRPAFRADGTITAANASSLNDGAATVILASERAVKEHGLEVMAQITGSASVADAPERFTTAPAKAITRVAQRTGIALGDIDLFEINEAFACVPLACARLAGVDLNRVNVNGGAVALGHPIGASGARVLVTLLHAMRDRGSRRGLATLCIGGGEAVSLVVTA